MTDFEHHVEEAMKEVVAQHQHHHRLYAETEVQQHIIDAKNERATFVLFEQIDTDRLTPESEGWLGDQYRYSVWIVEGTQKPRQLYEDHAYIRRSVSALTGSRGRNCSISLVELVQDGVIAEVVPKDAEGGMYAKVKVKITLDGKVEEPESFPTFVEEAENLVNRIGKKLGYDYVRSSEELEGQQVAVVVFGSENGRDYGYDIVYLVWKGADSKLHHRVVTDSRASKDYLSAKIEDADDEIQVNVEGNTYTFPKKDLCLK